MGEKRIKYVKNDLIEYEVYDLVDFYDPILRTPTTPYDFNQPGANKKAEYIMHSMMETLEKHGGLGLSANQVGLSHRICVINMGDQYWIMINPEIMEASGSESPYREGCLSYPGLFLKIKRPAHIKVRFYAVGGQEIVKEFDGLTATVIQHEVDHLDGKVYTDLVSRITLDREKKKVKTNLKKITKVSDNA
jgi:peptide deformylase